MKNDTISPTIYSSPITTSLQTVAAENIKPTDDKKHDRDHDEDNVKHLTLPNRLQEFYVLLQSVRATDVPVPSTQDYWILDEGE